VAPDFGAIHLQPDRLRGPGSNHPYAVHAPREVQRGGVTVPMGWQPGIERQALATSFYSQDSFHGSSIEPSGGACIPGPSAAASLVFRIDVGCDDIRLHPVMLRRLFGQSMVDRVEHGEAPIG